jgi:hypothetical protein
MPKQNVNFPESYDVIAGSKFLGGSSTELIRIWDPVVAVHWDKGDPFKETGAGVMLSLMVTPPITLAEAHELGGSAPEPSTYYSGTLSRADVNRLIASLKKARDAAYGRDE